MALPSIRNRREKRLERTTPWWILAGILSIFLLAACFLGIRAIQSSFDEPSGAMYFLIVLLGVLTLLLIGVVFFYTVRKRVMQERLGGTMIAWLNSHVYLGVLAVLAALCHAFLFPLSGTITSGKVTLFLLAVLVISGALWRIVYARVPPQVPTDVGNLSIRDSRDRALEHRIELDKLKVGKSRTFQEAADDLLENRRHPAEIDQIVAGLDISERTDWERVRHLVASINSESVRVVKQRRYAKVLQLWRAIHLPLAVFLLFGVLFHLYDVFNVGNLFKGEAEKQFASAKDCATCHGEIVDEWKLAMHRDAQTSTITVAQTLAALGASPELEKVCVNCHSPVGSQFSQSVTFPIEGDPGINPNTSGDEGVTCTVCHSMPEVPDELAGFEKLPIEKKGQLRLGTMVGPPLDGDDPVPNSAHDFDTGFMSDPISSSQLCGACHNVAVDIDGNGLGLADPNSQPVDSDGNGVLDENELDKDNDLVLQTTFNEWEDFLFENNNTGASCVDCHMPAGESGPIADGPVALSAPDRDRNEHTFVGVDYDLNTDYYEQGGMPEDALEKVLTDRQDLLQTAVDLSANIPPPKGGVLTAIVKLKNQTGHSFPTGFAFARQFWLEVSAKTSSGQDVCLSQVQGFNTPCASGTLSTPSDDLKTCDAQPVGALSDGTGVNVTLLQPFPANDCDPWLVNFQKLLTDGDPDGDGTFTEVPFQSLRAGLVKDRIRTVADPATDDAQVLAAIPQGKADTYAYQFDVGQVPQGESVSVRIVLHGRHLPPYFVRELGEFLPEDLTPDELLQNMTVVDMASNKPLGENLTNPDPSTLAKRASRRALAMRTSSASAPEKEADGTPWGAAPVLAALFVWPVAMSLRRLRRKGR